MIITKNNETINNYRFIIIGILMIIVLSVVSEYAIDLCEKAKYSECVIDVERLDPITDGSSYYYSFSVPEARYREFSFFYNSKNDFSYSLNSISEVAYSDREFAATDLKFRGGDVSLYIDCDEEMPHIRSVCFKTLDGSFNVSRCLCLSMLFFTALFILDKYSTSGNRQVMYLSVFGFIMGLMFISTIDFRLKGWDEQHHFNEAWKGSFIGMVKDNDIISEIRTESKYTHRWETDNLSEHEYVLSERDFRQEYNNTDERNTISISRLPYLPHSIGLLIGRMINLPADALFCFGKVFGLLFYLLILGIAGIMCPHFRNIIYVIGLLPTSLFLASVYSYDPFLISLTLLGMAIMMEEYLREDEVRMSRFFASVICILIGCIPKEIYIFLVIPWLFFDKSKYKSVKEYRISLLVTICVLLIGLSSFIVPTLLSLSGGEDIYSDYRRPEANVPEQIKHVFNHPLKYAGILLGSIYGTMDDFLFGSIYGLLGYLVFCIEIVTRTFPILLIVAGLLQANQWNSSAKKPVVSVKMKVVLFTVISIVIIVMWSVLYACFTSVGANRIDGVQPRYYLPILFPICMLLFTDKIHFDYELSRYNKIFMGLFMMACIFSMYRMFLSRF